MELLSYPFRKWKVSRYLKSREWSIYCESQNTGLTIYYDYIQKEAFILTNDYYIIIFDDLNTAKLLFDKWEEEHNIV